MGNFIRKAFTGHSSALVQRQTWGHNAKQHTYTSSSNQIHTKD